MKTITHHQIKAARCLLNLKQAELAEASAISLVVVSKVERGISNISRNSLQRIRITLEALGITFINQPDCNGVLLTTTKKDN